MPLPTIVQAITARVVKTQGFDPSTKVVELPIEAHQDPQSLIWSSTRSFVGTRQNIVDLAGALGGIKSITAYKDWEAFYELRVVYQGLDPANPPNPDSQIVTVWRLQPARITKPLWMIPLVRDLMLRLFADAPIRNKFRTDFEALVRGDALSNTATPFDGAGKAIADGSGGGSWKLSFTQIMSRYLVTAPADVAIFKALLGSYGLGTEGFQVPSVMLSRVDVAPSNASVGAAGVDFDNFGGLLTTGALLRFEKDIIPLIKSKILSSKRLMAGYWLKEMPSFSQEDANRVRVEANYTFSDDYDPFIYGAPVT